MDKMEILYLICGAIAGPIIDRLFISRKDTNDYAIKLIETLQKEIDRLNKKQDEMEVEYRDKYNKLEDEHKQLKQEHYSLIAKYEALKAALNKKEDK